MPNTENQTQNSPCTRASLAADLAKVLSSGDVVLVHSSLRKVGWICGGAEALVRAFTDVLGSGTLVVPTHTSENSDPSEWCAPPVPESWWPTIREQTPAFDPLVTRTRQMGALPETVRTWPGMARSAHPQTSFAAVGGQAERVTAGHALDSMLGTESPLARLEDLDAKVVLLGVGWDSCTAFHLPESRLPSVRRKKNSFAAVTNGKREWVTVEDLDADSDDFESLGAAFEAETGAVTRFKAGDAECRVFTIRDATDFAAKWLAKHRTVAE